MRQLNLDQIRALIEVIETGSFTAAARALHLTQPAISLQVQELEARFKVTLVERVGRRVKPTSAGLELAAIGRRLLEQAAEAHRIMRRYGEGQAGQVRIGMSMTALIYLMPPVIRMLRRTAPSLELAIRTGFSDATVAGVRDNTLDLGICTGPIADGAVAAVEYAANPLVAIFAADTPDAPDVVEPSMVNRWPVILGNQRSALRRLVVDWMGQAAPVPRPVLELDNVTGIKSVVGAGLGMSLIPDIALSEEDRAGRLIVRPLFPAITRSLLIVHHRDKGDDPAIQQVRNALIACMPRRA